MTNKAGILIYVNMGFIAEASCVAFLHRKGIWITVFSLFFVEDGADISVESTIVSFFKISPRPVSRATPLCEQLFLQAMFYKDAPEPTNNISVRHLDCWILHHRTRKRYSCRLFRLPCLIRQAIKILQYMQMEHKFQQVGLVTVFSFVVVRLDNGFPFFPRDDLLTFCQKFFLLRLHLSQLIAQIQLAYLGLV